MVTNPLRARAPSHMAAVVDLEVSGFDLDVLSDVGVDVGVTATHPRCCGPDCRMFITISAQGDPCDALCSPPTVSR